MFCKQRGYRDRVDETARHLRLLTETIAAVNSTLDLEEVLSLVASNVADALEADACFVYLYDEHSGELVLRATHGTRVEEMTGRPRMRPGDGITGAAAAARAPVMIPAQAHLDPRFKAFPNLPEDEYESILAVPVLARDKLAGRGRPAAGDRGAGGADDRAREALRRCATPGGRARGAGADLGSGLGVALPGGVAGSDRRGDRRCARSDRRGACARGRGSGMARGSVRPPRGPGAAALEGASGRRARLRPEHAVHGRGSRAARLDREPRRCGFGTRSGSAARRARSGDPSPGEEQPADGGVAPASASGDGRGRRSQGARGLRQPNPCDRRRPRGADRAAG